MYSSRFCSPGPPFPHSLFLALHSDSICLIHLNFLTFMQYVKVLKGLITHTNLSFHSSVRSTIGTPGVDPFRIPLFAVIFLEAFCLLGTT